MAALADLVLIPGTLNDADLWRDQIEGLRDVASCRVADITKDGSLRALAGGVLADAPDRFALAGFSLGGQVALEILRVAPGRVERLALLDASIEPDSPLQAAQRAAAQKSARGPGRFQGFSDRVLVDYLDPSHLDDETIVGRIRSMTERLGKDVFLRQSAIERADGADALAAFPGPVLILCGENDRLTPLADHRDMASLPDRAKLVIVPRSGHMTPIEQPEAVTSALRDWLALEA